MYSESLFICNSKNAKHLSTKSLEPVDYKEFNDLSEQEIITLIKNKVADGCYDEDSDDDQNYFFIHKLDYLIRDMQADKSGICIFEQEKLTPDLKIYGYRINDQKEGVEYLCRKSDYLKTDKWEEAYREVVYWCDQNEQVLVEKKTEIYKYSHENGGSYETSFYYVQTY